MSESGMERDPRYGLEEAVDGELPGERIARMRAHAADCPECAEEIARLLRIKELLRRSCGRAAAPSSLRERITVEYRSIEVSRRTGEGTSRASSSTVRISTTRRQGPTA